MATAPMPSASITLSVDLIAAAERHLLSRHGGHARRPAAQALVRLTNPLLPATDPLCKHFAVGSVGGVERNAYTVYTTTDAERRAYPNVVVVRALRDSRPNITVAVDVTKPE
jgi:hypothetical protein